MVCHTLQFLGAGSFVDGLHRLGFVGDEGECFAELVRSLQADSELETVELEARLATRVGPEIVGNVPCDRVHRIRMSDIFETENDSLTTGETAQLLGLSRAFVIRLIDEGKLSAHSFGTHRRVRKSNVLTYLTERERRLQQAAAISSADECLGSEYR
jgi:excisionase family DNA binding protein